MNKIGIPIMLSRTKQRRRFLTITLQSNQRVIIRSGKKFRIGAERRECSRPLKDYMELKSFILEIGCVETAIIAFGLFPHSLLYSLSPGLSFVWDVGSFFIPKSIYLASLRLKTPLTKKKETKESSQAETSAILK